MENSLTDILNGDEPTIEPEVAEVVEAPIVEQPEVVADAPAEGPLRGADGKFIPKGDKQADLAASATPAPQDETGPIPFAALKDERSKRQSLEAELAQLRQSMAQPQQPQAEAQPMPDMWEDPEGWRLHVMAEAQQAARTEAQQTYQFSRIEQSAVKAKAKYGDYGEAHQVFGEMIQRTPGLFEQMMQSEDPAEFAYTQAKTEMEIRQYGGLDALVEARIAARLAQQNQLLADTPQHLPQSVPLSISSDRSVGARGGPAWAGPASLGDILK